MRLFFLSAALATAPLSAKPLTVRMGETWVFAVRGGSPVKARKVARRVNTKYAAKLKFRADESFDEGGKIDKLLRKAHVAQDIGAKESGE